MTWVFAAVIITAIGVVLYRAQWRDLDTRMLIELTPERRAMIVQQERLEQQLYRHMNVSELL